MSQKKNMLLVVDTEPQTKKMLEIVLPDNSFVVEECKTGKQAIGLSITLKPDIILLDLDLPDMNGHDVIKSLREWSHVPMIILTARSANEDVIRALDLGADDYVLKPFNISILQARIKANLRKSAVHEEGVPELVNGILRIDLVRHQVFLGEKIVALTPKEYNLLRYFMTHTGKMLTHREILHEVWGAAHVDDDQYLRVFIGKIRKKIEANPSTPSFIKTEVGVGYTMPEQVYERKSI